jgi:LysM repeat protein
LFGLAAQCGHRDLSVVSLIVELNDLSAPEAIQVGQEILIPWPTPTVDPNLPTATEAAASSDGEGQALTVLDAMTPLPVENPTETLLPGVGWHTVRLNETMLGIAVQYGASAEVLSQLNPEVPFLQCDFALNSGGPRCIVQLVEGQRIRVPVPTPTPTATWTPSGSETPTPSATPTFNAPISLSPGDRTLFQSDQLVTLRWIATGTLGADEAYRVRVIDLTSGLEYAAETRELFFIVPVEWQGVKQRRHEFSWTVSVIRLNAPEPPIFTTEPRLFIWESRTASS